MNTEYYQKLREEIKASGKSISAYCDEYNLNKNQIYAGLGKLRRKEEGIKVVKVNDSPIMDINSPKELKVEVNNIKCTLSYNTFSELASIMEIIKNV